MSLRTTLIDVAALAALPAGDVLIVDCRFDLADPDRSAREYREGHIPGAVYASLDQDLLIRRSILIGLGAGLRIIGSRYSPDTRRLRDSRPATGFRPGGWTWRRIRRPRPDPAAGRDAGRHPDRAAGRAVPQSQQRRAGRRDRAAGHPLSHSNLLTDRGVTQSAGADLAGDHLAGVQAHPQPQVDTVPIVDPGGEPLRLLLNPYGRQAGANGMVLQRDWCAEHRHDAVARELA